MGGDHALVEDRAALWVDPGGDIGSSYFASRGTQFVRVLRQGQRVKADDAENALGVVLQRDPVANRAEIIATMQIAGLLNAGKEARQRTSNAGASGDVTAPRRRWSSGLPASPSHQIAPIGDPEYKREHDECGEPRADQHGKRADLQHRVT